MRNRLRGRFSSRYLLGFDARNRICWQGRTSAGAFRPRALPGRALCVPSGPVQAGCALTPTPGGSSPVFGGGSAGGGGRGLTEAPGRRGSGSSRPTAQPRSSAPLRSQHRRDLGFAPRPGRASIKLSVSNEQSFVVVTCWVMKDVSRINKNENTFTYILNYCFKGRAVVMQQTRERSTTTKCPQMKPN